MFQMNGVCEKPATNEGSKNPGKRIHTPARNYINLGGKQTAA